MDNEKQLAKEVQRYADWLEQSWREENPSTEPTVKQLVGWATREAFSLQMSSEQ
jgi:hypothetical protein